MMANVGLEKTLRLTPQQWSFEFSMHIGPICPPFLTQAPLTCYKFYKHFSCGFTCDIFCSCLDSHFFSYSVFVKMEGTMYISMLSTSYRTNR